MIDLVLSLHLCFNMMNKAVQRAKDWRMRRGFKRQRPCQIEKDTGRQMMESAMGSKMIDRPQSFAGRWRFLICFGRLDARQ